MYHFIQKFHSGWAYIALLMLVIATVNAVFGFVAKKDFSTTDRKVSLFGMLSIHIQLLIGLLLYFISPVGLASLGQMADKSLRLTSLEHPLINLIAIALITVGWSKHKKAHDGTSKHRVIAIFYAIGLLLILSRIPWSLWF